MYRLLLLSVLVSAAFAQSFYYAIDINQLGTSSYFTCLRSSYSTVFVRGYVGDSNGYVDSNANVNLQLAYQAGLGIEVYMTPSPASGTKSAQNQVDEVVTNLANGGFAIRSLWIQVTSPVNWPNSQNNNLNFITSAIQRIQARGIRAGIYTSAYDWNQITNNANALSSDVMLWYWSVLGAGPAGESPANFGDFRAFGPWFTPAVKQFGQAESICGFVANRDVYPANSVRQMDTLLAKTKAESEKKMLIGGIGF